LGLGAGCLRAVHPAIAVIVRPVSAGHLRGFCGTAVAQAYAHARGAEASGGRTDFALAVTVRTVFGPVAVVVPSVVAPVLRPSQTLAVVAVDLPITVVVRAVVAHLQRIIPAPLMVRTDRFDADRLIADEALLTVTVRSADVGFAQRVDRRTLAGPERSGETQHRNNEKGRGRTHRAPNS
jgi:hypothetical protein